MSTNIQAAEPSERLNDQNSRSDMTSLRSMSERSGSVCWSLYDSDSDSSCAATENYQDMPYVSYSFSSLVPTNHQNVSGHTWTESLIKPSIPHSPNPSWAGSEVQFQAHQQQHLKESLWIRLNAQRRRKSHTLDVSGSVSWIMGIKSSTLLQDGAENNLSR